MRNLKKLTLTLVALFAMTTGAWADGTVYNTTVELKDLKVGDVLTDGFSLTTAIGQYINFKGYKKDGGSPVTDAYQQLEVTGVTFPGGVTISKSGSNYTPYADGKDANAWIVKDFKDYGSATMLYLDGYNYTPAPAGTALKPDATRKVWTLDAMPAGNVELQVAYFPGMLTLPAKTAQGSIEVVGLSGATLPAGFDTDGTNIYVEPKTQFKVKAVPAEGYHLVSLSDGTNTYDVDADGIATVTMPEGDADLTLTATFSDEFELTFDDVNFKTNANITVKVGDADKTLDQDGKLSVKSGQTVTLTAKQGYKFRSVEAKKGAGAGPVTLAEATVGMLVGSDGKAYPADYERPEGVFYRAVVAYKDGTHGLAITTLDQGGSGIENNWNAAKSECEGNTAITGATWRMPSEDDWKAMFTANGGNTNSYAGLSTLITTAGGKALSGTYWSSTGEPGNENNRARVIEADGWSESYKSATNLARAVLAW